MIKFHLERDLLLPTSVVEVDIGRTYRPTTGRLNDRLVREYTLWLPNRAKPEGERGGCSLLRKVSLSIEDRFTKLADKPIHLRSRLIEIKLRPDYGGHSIWLASPLPGGFLTLRRRLAILSLLSSTLTPTLSFTHRSTGNHWKRFRIRRNLEYPWRNSTTNRTSIFQHFLPFRRISTFSSRLGM